MTVVIGTRGSALALAQTRLVASRLGDDVEVRVLHTAGDRSERPIRTLGDGAFVATIEEALLRREVDVAVHSLKDLPTAEREGLAIAAVPEREDPRDVLVTASRGGVASLRDGPAPPCPRCGAVTGEIIRENSKAYGCTSWKSKEEPGCGFVIWKRVASRTLTPEIARQLIEERRTREVLSGFRSRNGKPFRARLVLNDEDKIEFEFPVRAQSKEPAATE